MELILAQMPVFTQLLVAMGLGMLIGIERTLAHKTAGLRTYGLVALGSCVFILSIQALGANGAVTIADLTRVIAGVTTGIGFLGAGVIILREQTAIGLTTAAGLWVTAGIGISVGLGLYGIAVSATILTLLALTVFWFVEHRLTQ